MKGLQGSEFYDNPEVFERYINHRKRIENPNELIEKPIFLELIHGIKGNVLDLIIAYHDASPIFYGGEEGFLIQGCNRKISGAHHAFLPVIPMALGAGGGKYFFTSDTQRALRVTGRAKKSAMNRR